MPTPEEVDAVGVYGPIDVAGRSATVARWRSPTYEGRVLPHGRWYHVLAGDGVTSFGMIDAAGEFYAWEPALLGHALGRAFRTLNEAVSYLVDAGFEK